MDLKKYIEKRNALIEEASGLLTKAETEIRAFNDEENKRYDEIKKEVDGLNAQIKKIEELRALEDKHGADEGAQGQNDEPENKKSDDAAADEAVERRCFENMIRDLKNFEVRDADGFTRGDNGIVIPASIANKIIETVEDICPIFNGTSKYNVKGKLTFPIYDEGTSAITCGYAEEFTALAASKAGFKSVSLEGFLAGVLAKISISLINNSQFDIVPYVVNKIALAISRFLEHECLIGTTNKMEGALSSKNVVTTSTTGKIVADDLIDLQAEIKDALQGGCCWTMNKETLTAIRKLKDSDGNYILNRDIANSFGWNLLGKPVYLSDNMPAIANGAIPVLYGDYSGLYTKMTEGISIQVLVEKYIDEHVIGVAAWLEVDSKIVEPQKLAVLKIKGTATPGT